MDDYRKFQEKMFDELDFLKKKGKARETIEFLGNLLPPENNGELDKLIEQLEKDLGAKGHPFLVGKSRSARVKFVKYHIKRLEDDL